ncbi:lactate racemase domain-containing protein [Candidatus Zixiibacteriota bacterium]
MLLPEMLTLRRRLTVPREKDPVAAVRRELARLDLSSRVPEGGTIAIPVGSRGITGIAAIIASTVTFLKESGFVPFIVPAMGSHGGGTAAGQVELLTSLGITEGSIGAPIRASMETVVVGHTERGLPVHVDREANDADAIVVINRVKPHTEFQGPVESGLLKMMLIGLGKLEGATLYHRAAVQIGFATLAREAVPVVMAQSGVVGGLAILENAREEIARIEAVPIEDIFDHESRLLTEASELMARLPFFRADLLLVDRMGKNISGAGLDPNVTGRGGFENWEGVQDRRPKTAEVTRLVVRELTPESHGNALGIGLADLIPRRLAEQIDWEKTGLNAITALVPYKGRRPVVLPTDRDCIETALDTCGLQTMENAQVIHISDTLHLEVIRVSEAYRREVEARDDLEIVDKGDFLRFDSEGNLLDPVPLT